MSEVVAVRVDWSCRIGQGHLQRCLSLLDALTASSDIRGIVLARWLPGQEASLVTSRGYELRLLDMLAVPDEHAAVSDVSDIANRRDADGMLAALHGVDVAGVVVDHYDLNAVWEQRVKAALGVPLLAIDGIADREHVADLVVDPAFLLDSTGRWDSRIAPWTRLLQGPRHALVAPSYAAALAERPERDGAVRRVLISFGGTDAQGLTMEAMAAIERVGHGAMAMDVVVGGANPALDAIRERCRLDASASFHKDTRHMPVLMCHADVAIGAGGATTYERAFLGLPAIVITVADNQVCQTTAVATTGAIAHLGAAGTVSRSLIEESLRRLREDPARVRAMSRAARRIVGDSDEPGSVRVAQEFLQLLDPRQRMAADTQ